MEREIPKFSLASVKNGMSGRNTTQFHKINVVLAYPYSVRTERWNLCRCKTIPKILHFIDELAYFCLDVGESVQPNGLNSPHLHYRLVKIIEIVQRIGEQLIDGWSGSTRIKLGAKLGDRLRRKKECLARWISGVR